MNGIFDYLYEFRQTLITTKVPRYFTFGVRRPDSEIWWHGNVSAREHWVRCKSCILCIYINVARIFLLPETNYIIILPRSIIFALRGLPHSIPIAIHRNRIYDDTIFLRTIDSRLFWKRKKKRNNANNEWSCISLLIYSFDDDRSITISDTLFSFTTYSTFICILSRIK